MAQVQQSSKPTVHRKRRLSQGRVEGLTRQRSMKLADHHGATLHVTASSKMMQKHVTGKHGTHTKQRNPCHRCVNSCIAKQFRTNELSLRQKYQVLMTNSVFGMVWDVAMMILSFGTIGLFVYATYAADKGRSLLCNAEFILAIVFTADYLIQWAVSDNRAWYIFSFYSFVDLLTIIPVYVEVFDASTGCFAPAAADGHESANNSDTSLLFIRIMRLFKILRILRYAREGRGFNMTNLVYLKVFKLALTLLIIVFFGAGCIYVVETVLFEVIHGGNLTTLNSQLDYGEPPYIEWTFGDCMYFTFVTISTVGYGDFTPTSGGSKFVAMSLIGVTLVLIPSQIRELAELLNAVSRYRRTFRATRDFGGPHAIVACCGSTIAIDSLQTFVTEFYHPNHLMKGGKSTTKQMHMVVVADSEPVDHKLRAILAAPLFREFLHYFSGSILREKDLMMIDIMSAKACFILPDPRQPQADSAVVMHTMAARHFNPGMGLYVQTIEPHCEAQLRQGGVKAEAMFSRKRLFSQLMTAGCLYPGVSTLIDNLMHSFSDLEMYGEPWQSNEYFPGAGMEVYEVSFPDFMERLSFRSAARTVFEVFKGTISVIGVMQKRSTGSSRPGAQTGRRGTSWAHQTRHKKISIAKMGTGNNLDVIGLAELFLGKRNQYEVIINPTKDFEIQPGSRAVVISESYLTAVTMSDRESYGLHDEEIGGGMADLVQPSGVGQQLEEKGSNAHLRSFAHTINGRCAPELLEPVSSPKTPSGVHSASRNSYMIVPKKTERALSNETVSIGTIQLKDHIVCCRMPPDPESVVLILAERGFRVVILDDQVSDAEIDRLNRKIHHQMYKLKQNPNASRHHLTKHVLSVRGFPTSSRALRKAGIRHATGCIIFGDNEADEMQNASEAVLCYLAVFNCCICRPDFDKFMSHVVVQVKGQLMPHILGDGCNSRLHKDIQTRRLSERVAAAMEAKGKKNVNIRKIFRRVLNASKYADEGGIQLSLDAARKSPLFASGSCINTDFIEGLLGLAIHVPCTMQVIACMLGTHAGTESSLVSVPIPTAFVGKTYEELYHNLLEHDGLLAIGLYRSSNRTRLSFYPYVYTAPAPGCVLQSNDSVFVFTQWKALAKSSVEDDTTDDESTSDDTSDNGPSMTDDSDTDDTLHHLETDSEAPTSARKQLDSSNAEQTSDLELQMDFQEESKAGMVVAEALRQRLDKGPFAVEKV